MVNMNIEQFFDIIADPNKYQVYLKALQEEQSRLNDAIETVGKASEIEKMQKQIKIELENANTILAEAEQKAADKLEKADAFIASKKLELQNSIDEYTQLVAENKITLKDSKVAKKELMTKLVDVDAKLAEVNAEKEKLSTLVAEYEDRIAKLRSVMS